VKSGSPWARSVVTVCSPFDRKLENQNSNGVKTSLDLPADLLREIKLRAVNEGKNLTEVISELLRRGLGKVPVGTDFSAGRRGSITLPLFPSSPAAPATRMSIEELQNLEQQALTQADLESIHPTSR
jgi:hypothetical protein